MSVRYLSVCSGIEAATVAWHPIRWEPAAFSEIEPFPRSVLAHHYPNVPIHGDFTTISSDDYGSVDILVGGTPCQSFSVAGLRKGMDDDRGNLALEFARLAQRVRPRWIVWENVPGVLSSNSGRDFGSILGALEQLGYGWSYRILDAQYFGVPQRRRRVFVVGRLGDFRRAAAVLFERHSLQGHPAPRRKAGEDISPCLDVRAGRSGETTFHRSGGLVPFDTAQASRGFDASEDGTGRGTPLAAAFDWQSGGDMRECDLKQSAQLQSCQTPAVFDCRTALAPHGAAVESNTASTLRSSDHKEPQIMRRGGTVRRLTPKECERLQGFPDDYTLVPHRGKPAADRPRYKALGNSMAVPVMRWIVERIRLAEGLTPWPQ